MTPKKVGTLTDFIDYINGEFVYINCDIFPMTAFFYRDRTVLQKKEFYDLPEYFSELTKMLGIESKNLEFVQRNHQEILEVIMNEDGIVKISLKGEHYAK